MFGFGSSKNEDPQAQRVRDIRRRSQQIRQGGLQDARADDGGGRRRATGFVISVFCAVTAGFAVAAGKNQTMGNFPLRFPALGNTVNELVFSAHPAVAGNAAADLALGAAAKALAICLCAAFLPLCARLWTRLRDNAQGSPYITFWGTTVTLPFAWFFVKDFFGPLLVDIFDVIS